MIFYGAKNAGQSGVIRFRDNRVEEQQTASIDTADGSLVAGSLTVGGGTRLKKMLVGSATYDPPQIQHRSAETMVLAVIGAASADFVTSVTHSSITGGAWTLTGYVNQLDKVTVVLQNNTGGTVNLPSGTLRVLVMKL
jgi:hypothetical protein